LRTKLTLFHGVANMEIHAPGISWGAIARQQELIHAAEKTIADIQRACGTALHSIVEMGSGHSALRKAAEEAGARLLVMDSPSDEWGDNFRIYAALRICDASILIHRTSKDEVASPVHGFRGRRILATLIIGLILALAASLISLAFYLGSKTDNCRAAPIRCNVPAEFRFQPYDDSGQEPSAPAGR
jgi:hypothetical protein